MARGGLVTIRATVDLSGREARVRRREPGQKSVGPAIMLKRIIVASALAVFSIGLPGCQSSAMRQLAGVSTMPGSLAVQACEAQKRRTAGLVKTLAYNYNAERVH